MGNLPIGSKMASFTPPKWSEQETKPEPKNYETKPTQKFTHDIDLIVYKIT